MGLRRWTVALALVPMLAVPINGVGFAPPLTIAEVRTAFAAPAVAPAAEFGAEGAGQVAVARPTDVPVHGATAAPDTPVQWFVDGKAMPVDVPPVIVAGRTLVPFRPLFSALGAEVTWTEATRTVSAVRGDRYVRLRIGSRLACLQQSCADAVMLDVPAEIRSGRTFVPARFVATAMGALLTWDPVARAVFTVTKSGQAPESAAPATLEVATPVREQRLTGPTEFTVRLADPGKVTEVRYYLLDLETGRGPLVGMAAPDQAVSWLPDPAFQGRRLLVAAAEDGTGGRTFAQPVPIDVQPDVQVTVTGVTAEQVIRETVTLRPRLAFVATHVRYELSDPGSGSVITLGEGDPQGNFGWWPAANLAGRYLLRAVAVDRLGREYPGAAVPVQIATGAQVQLTGVHSGQTITAPVSLQVRANFSIARVRYRWGDPNGAAATVVETEKGSAGQRWFPKPVANGTGSLWAEVWDERGRMLTTAPVPVQVRVQPMVQVHGVAPNLMVTGPVTLGTTANHPWTRVEFRLSVPGAETGEVVAVVANLSGEFRWEPQASQAGRRVLQAIVTDAEGRQGRSDAIPVRVFLGQVFGPVAVAPKAEFLALATRLALPSAHVTGMSAALQVAQAIHETGWGQSTPVDKYSGRASLNLFGIKGSGPAGSVIHNTWEEYGGVAFRVDDYFRAYSSIEAGWQDHKQFLLTRERYAPVRAVMWDPVQAAWALYRAGYATDSRYAPKLIGVMQRNDLFRLDQVDP